MDDRIPAAPGRFSQADASPVYYLSCARCSRKHDGRGSKRWILATRLRICRWCVAEREERSKGRCVA